MKKTLIAAAALTAMAASAMAANVTLSGRVDYSVLYTHDAAGKDTVQMKSGFTTGNRWAITTTEKISKNTTVGAILESGFTGDDGKMGGYKDSLIFDRECSLFVKGAFGTFTFGRTRELSGDASSTAVFTGVDAFGDSWGNAAYSVVGYIGGKLDNVYTYKTPTADGFTGYLQYAAGSVENMKASKVNTRKIEAAVDFVGKSGKVVAVVAKALNQDDDYLTIQLGGNLKLGAVTLFAEADYADKANYDWKGGLTEGDKAYHGSVSASVKACGGTINGLVGYGHNKDVNSDTTKGWNAALGYQYNFSKSTYAYGAYTFKKVEDDKTHQAVVGMVHKF